ncbi:hypothetical protein [Microvirga sp. P5_D2]|jgi:hypothetical protein
MTPRVRLTLCCRIGLVVTSFVLIGAIVAEPLLRPLWSPQVAIAQLGTGGSR